MFLWKFCFCRMFFMIEWFLMVFILLFKCTFASSLVCFSKIISKIWCSFCFVYYVRNLALVGKGKIKFIYTFTTYCSCCLFRDSFFIMHIDNWFNICQTAVTYFHIIFVEYLMIFMVVGSLLELKEKNIYRFCWRRSLEKTGWARYFFCNF